MCSLELKNWTILPIGNADKNAHSQCYCSSYNETIPNPEIDYIRYPDSACNTPCPGNPSQKCGGVVIVPRPSPSISLTLLKEKRQFSTENEGEAIIVTVYNGTLEDAEPGPPSSSSTPDSSTPDGTATSTPGVSATNGAGIGSTSSSTTLSSSASEIPGTSSSLSSICLSSMTSNSVSQAINPTLGSTSTTVTNTSIPPSSSSPAPSTAPNPSSTSSSSSSPVTLWPTVISTSYTTICPIHPSICPTPTPTCLSTTITVLHCGCTDLPRPSVPMTTAIAPCGHVCSAGRETWNSSPPENHETGGWNDWHEVSGVVETEILTTLTIPCTREIQELQLSVEVWYQASATAGANTAGEAGTNQSHEARPYSFPIPFPFSVIPDGTAAVPVPVPTTATLTLALTNGSSKSSDGSGSANGTWTAAAVTPYASSPPSEPGTPSGTTLAFGSAASPRRSPLVGPSLHAAVLLVSLAVFLFPI